MFQIGDRVRNGSLIETIIDAKENSRLGIICFLVKYDIRSIKRLNKRKLWTFGLNLRRIK